MDGVRVAWLCVSRNDSVLCDVADDSEIGCFWSIEVSRARGEKHTGHAKIFDVVMSMKLMRNQESACAQTITQISGMRML